MQAKKRSSTRRSRSNRRNAIRTLHRNDTVGLLLLGKCEVGKTALVKRWMEGIYTENYTPTVEDFHVKSFNYMSQTANIGIIDMTGSRDFPAMIDLYLNRVDSVMLIYDVGDESSIKEIAYLYEKVKKVRDESQDVHICIVGTKVDQHTNKNEEFKNETIEEIIEDFGKGCKHVLTSAKNNINVNEAFEGALNDIVQNFAPSGDNLKRLEKIMNKDVEHIQCRCLLM